MDKNNLTSSSPNTIIAENEINIKHKLQLDPVEYSSKPNNTETRKINDRIVKHTVEIDIIKFSEQITSPHSQTWMPAHLEGSRKNDSWKSQSIFALDFDDGITLTEVLGRLSEYSLDCTFAYSTFSSTSEKPKFRVIWQLSEVITDRNARDSIQLALMQLFPEADKACKDASRIFYGGKEIIYKNYNFFLNVELMIHAARLYSIRDVSDSNVARSFDRFDKHIKLEELRASPIVYIGDAHFSSISSPYLYSSGKSDYEILERVDWDDLADRVKIFADLLNPVIKLEHRQLLGLATSLVYMKGGAELFVRCIDANPVYSQSEKKRIINDCRKHKYNPARLSFSPYEEDKQYESLYQAAKLPKGKVIRLKNSELMTLKEAEIKLTEALNEALADTSNSIWIIKKATGLGGTECLLNLERPAILAFPNHKLKDEVAQRIRRFKVKPIITPPLPERIPKALKKKLEYYYSIGAINAAQRLIKEHSRSNSLISQYWRKTLSAFTSKGTVLTTHSKALFVDFDKHDTIIFDEDPLPSVLELGEITLEDLNTLANLVKSAKDKANLLKYVKLLTDNLHSCVESTKEVSFEDIESIEDAVISYRPTKKGSTFNSSILKFLNSDYYALDEECLNILTYLKHNSLNSSVLANKKIIIMSATAEEYIYRQLYGDRVKFIDISNVEPEGVVIQDTQFSYSRRSLDNRKVIEHVTNLIKRLPVITFKDYRKYFGSAIKEVYYWKCTGFDGLKGKHIAVIGTPYTRKVHYLLYAKALGIKLSPQDFRLEDLRVQYKGLEFKFKTFTRPELQLIQLHQIESEIIQAVGRARVLRYDCIVYLFAGLPYAHALVTDEEKAPYSQKLKAVVDSSTLDDEWEIEGYEALAA